MADRGNGWLDEIRAYWAEAVARYEGQTDSPPVATEAAETVAPPAPEAPRWSSSPSQPSGLLSPSGLEDRDDDWLGEIRAYWADIAARYEVQMASQPVVGEEEAATSSAPPTSRRPSSSLRAPQLLPGFDK